MDNKINLIDPLIDPLNTKTQYIDFIHPPIDNIIVHKSKCRRNCNNCYKNCNYPMCMITFNFICNLFVVGSFIYCWDTVFPFFQKANNSISQAQSMEETVNSLVPLISKLDQLLNITNPQ